MIEFTSPTYIASILLKQGVNNSIDQVVKYGLIDKSYEFALLPPAILSDSIEKLMER